MILILKRVATLAFILVLKWISCPGLSVIRKRVSYPEVVFVLERVSCPLHCRIIVDKRVSSMGLIVDPGRVCSRGLLASNMVPIPPFDAVRGTLWRFLGLPEEPGGRPNILFCCIVPVETPPNNVRELP
ncbi:hypothetical protein CSUI_004391 [Cystoisospora suis]|uniref:Uncharacterized protein n=1 Tax=Cystoisospora suis TaxID=483139 RepID=A0A2C6KXH0_9APIC|nr:hypothetical protein CSUI_004391 [Cystoisospora suis]